MKIIIYSILALCMLTSLVTAQPCDSLWTRSYGGLYDSEFDCILPTSDGGYYIGGYNCLFQGSFGFLWLVRTDANGDTIWTRTYGFSSFGMVDAMCYTPDSGLILTGCTSNITVESDVWIVKMDANGDSAWSRTYPNEEYQALRSIKVLTDGYIFAGSGSHGDETGHNVWLLKLSLEGDSMWSRSIGGLLDEGSYDIVALPDGGLAIAAYARAGIDDYDYWLIRTNANGDTLWTRSYGGSTWDIPSRIIRISNGDFILGGHTHDSEAYSDIWLLRTDANGDSLWSQTYGGTRDDDCVALIEQEDGGLVVVGVTSSFGVGSRDFYIFRTLVDGSIAWQRTFGTRYDDWAYDVVQTDPCGFTIAGTGRTWNHRQAWLVRMYTPEDNVSALPMLPREFSMRAFPNPFNANANIVFTLPQSLRVNLSVYDIMGRAVETKSEWFNAGENHIRFDGSGLPTGIYFTKVAAGEYSATQKLMLLK